MISQEDHLPYIEEYNTAQDITTLLQGGHVQENYKVRICRMYELIDEHNVTSKQAGSYWT